MTDPCDNVLSSKFSPLQRYFHLLLVNCYNFRVFLQSVLKLALKIAVLQTGKFSQEREHKAMFCIILVTP